MLQIAVRAKSTHRGRWLSVSGNAQYNEVTGSAPY